MSASTAMVVWQHPLLSNPILRAMLLKSLYLQQVRYDWIRVTEIDERGRRVVR